MKSKPAPKPLIVLDIDGTLLDENYQVNSAALPGLIESLEGDGFAFCINSNRSLHDLLPVAEQFKITGPLIGEDGVFIYQAETNTSRYLLSHHQLETIADLKEQAQRLLSRQLEDTYGAGKVFWEDIDTVEKISHHDSGKYSEGAVVVLNNKYRQFTVSAHLKRVIKGELVSMRDEVAEVAEALRLELDNEHEVTVSYSPLFANVLVSSRLASKRGALEALRNQGFDYSELYVIGDEMSDFKMVDGLGVFLTVQNAPDEVKACAKRVAAASCGQGVVELLKIIASQSLGRLHPVPGSAPV